MAMITGLLHQARNGQPDLSLIKPLRIVLQTAELAILSLGVLALVHLASLNSPNLLLCLAQIEGRSMEPTLLPGDQIVFARLPWHSGSIVLAEVGDSRPVIKRVIEVRPDRVTLCGDNRRHSEAYLVSPDCIGPVFVCRPPVHSPFGIESAFGRANGLPEDPVSINAE